MRHQNRNKRLEKTYLLVVWPWRRGRPEVKYKSRHNTQNESQNCGLHAADAGGIVLESKVTRSDGPTEKQSPGFHN